MGAVAYALFGVSSGYLKGVASMGGPGNLYMCGFILYRVLSCAGALSASFYKANGDAK